MNDFIINAFLVIIGIIIGVQLEKWGQKSNISFSSQCCNCKKHISDYNCYWYSVTKQDKYAHKSFSNMVMVTCINCDTGQMVEAQRGNNF